MFDRITFDPQIMGGRACIREMRIPVSVRDEGLHRMRNGEIFAKAISGNRVILTLGE